MLKYSDSYAEAGKPLSAKQLNNLGQETQRLVAASKNLPAGGPLENETLYALIGGFHGNINIPGNKDLSSYNWIQVKADDVGNMVPVVDGKQGFGNGVSPALAFNTGTTFSGQIVMLSPFPFPLTGRASPWLINPMSQPTANLTAFFFGYAWIYPDTIGTLTSWPRRMPVAMHQSSYLRRFYYFPNLDFAAGYYGLNGNTPSPAGERFMPQPSAIPSANYGWGLGSQDLIWFPPRSGEVGFSQPYRDQGVQWHLLFGNQKHTLWTSENGGGSYTPRYGQSLWVLDAFGNSAPKQTNGNGSFTGLGPLGLRFADRYNLLFVKDDYWYDRQITCTILGMTITNVKYLQPPDMYTPPPPTNPMGAPL